MLKMNKGLRQESEAATINKVTDQSNMLPCELTLLRTELL